MTKPSWYCSSISAQLVFGVLTMLASFSSRHLDVADGDGDAGLRGVVEAQVLDLVEHFGGLLVAEDGVNLGDYLLEDLPFSISSFRKPIAVGECVVEDDPPGGGPYLLAVHHDR